MIEILKHSFLHMLEDVPALFIFLFLTYLVLGFMESTSEEKSRRAIAKAGRFSPAIGAALGAFPQCGFSAAAANFYSAGIINMGTLVAVFMSTSDEMLPVFIAEKVDISVIGRLIGLKVLIGTTTGYIICLTVRWLRKKYGYKPILKETQQEIKQDEYCSMHGQVNEEEEHCSHFKHKHHHKCTPEGLIRGALGHSVRITLFIMVISFILNIIISIFGEGLKSGNFATYTWISIFVAGLVGLIPNCAASVIISELYIEGILCTGAMISGLLVSAGVGLIVLFRENKSLKENLIILGTLYGAAVIWGMIFQLLDISLV